MRKDIINIYYPKCKKDMYALCKLSGFVDWPDEKYEIKQVYCISNNLEAIKEIFRYLINSIIDKEFHEDTEYINIVFENWLIISLDLIN